jgi:hypothetical protein
MIFINDAIIEIISQDFESKVCFLEGTLNLSQYAIRIKPELDNILFKTTKIQSIVVALHRLQTKLSKDHFEAKKIKAY